jgi:hypothetical protein
MKPLPKTRLCAARMGAYRCMVRSPHGPRHEIYMGGQKFTWPVGKNKGRTGGRLGGKNKD